MKRWKHTDNLRTNISENSLGDGSISPINFTFEENLEDLLSDPEKMEARLQELQPNEAQKEIQKEAQYSARDQAAMVFITQKTNEHNFLADITGSNI